MPRNRWKALIGYVLALMTLIYAARHFGLSGDLFSDALRQISLIGVLLALVAFGLQILLNSRAFAYLNQAFGVDLPVGQVSQIWAGSILTKYVPGGIWHVVGRGLMLERLGVPARISAMVGVVEQGVSLSVCLVIAVTLILHERGQGWAAVLWISVSGALLVWLGSSLLARFVEPLSTKPWRRALGGYAIAMVPYALGYLAIVTPMDDVAFLQALFSGTVAGMLALPVPGGLGVRESSAALLVSPTQAGPVLATMLVARMLILITEAVASAIGLIALQFSKRSA